MCVCVHMFEGAAGLRRVLGGRPAANPFVHTQATADDWRRTGWKRSFVCVCVCVRGGGLA